MGSERNVVGARGRLDSTTCANHLSLAFLTPLIILCPTITGFAQDQDVSPAEQHRFFTLTRLEPSLELRAEYDDTRVKSDTRNVFDPHRSQNNRRLGFEEFVSFDLAGNVIDPTLFNFAGRLDFGLTQDRFHEGGDAFSQTDEDHGQLLRYDLRANLFTGRPISGSIYGQRADDRINRRFQPTLHERRNGFGTSWSFVDATFPMDLSYDYLETDRTGNGDENDDEHYTQSTLHYGLDWNLAPDHRLRFAYDHSDNKQEYQGLNVPYETMRELFRLEDLYQFGGAAQHKLKTVVHWQEESGDFARDLFEIGPQLTLHHSDELQTRYEYQFNRERYEALDVLTHRADWQLIHQLYSNLTTTLDLFGLHENVDGEAKTTQYGGSVDWQYNRKNPFGRFHADLALAYDTEEVHGDSGRRLIIDEAVTFRDPFPTTLRNRDVILTSLVVSDVNNRRIFRKGIDYLVRPVANTMQIDRVFTGLIADGDTVFVDYQIERPVDGQIDTIRTDFTIEQRFDNGLTPYYRLSYRNQETDGSSGFDRRADRTDHHRIGLTYDLDRWSLKAEYEIFDDTVDPYHGFHLGARYAIWKTPDHTLDASARFSRLYFEDDLNPRNVSLIDWELDHRWRLTERLSTVERVAYRYEDDSSRGLTHAVDVSAGIEYAWGDLSGEITLDYDHLGLPGSSEDDIGVFFRLRRDFPNAFGPR